MESKTKKKNKPDKNFWLDVYREFVLTNEKNPSSVFQLARQAGATEAEFFSEFSSLTQLETAIWKGHLDAVFAGLDKNPEWDAFSGREKVLLFFFSLLQQLKKDRSFICWSVKNMTRPGRPSAPRKVLSSRLKSWFTLLVDESAASGEVKERLQFHKHFASALLAGFWFILSFWCKDESPDFEDSDALIEKSIGLGFDLMGESPLEKAVDLGRFLFGRISTAY
jgi:hypothetical protein